MVFFSSFFNNIIVFDCRFLTVSWLERAAAALIRGCAKHNLFDIACFLVAAAPHGMCSSDRIQLHLCNAF